MVICIAGISPSFADDDSDQQEKLWDGILSEVKITNGQVSILIEDSSFELDKIYTVKACEESVSAYLPTLENHIGYPIRVGLIFRNGFRYAKNIEFACERP